MRAVITVVGKDTVGIIAEVTRLLSEHRINILDISQSVLQELFAMVMLVELSDADMPLRDMSDALVAAGEAKGVKVNVMHEDIFTTMHHI